MRLLKKLPGVPEKNANLLTIIAFFTILRKGSIVVIPFLDENEGQSILFILKQYYSKPRNETLDCFRGIFVFLGALGHFYYIADTDGSPLKLYEPVAIFLYNILYGSAVFFAISGFLITSLLLNKVDKSHKKFNQVSVFSFYLFRFARIFPALILLCCLNLLFNWVDFPEFQIKAPLTWQTVLTYVFTLRANVLFGQDFYHICSWGCLWSLAIEEVFYLFYPLICFAFRSFRSIILVLSAIVIYGLYCRSQSTLAITVIRTYFGCFDQLALGCIAAYLVHMNCFAQTRRRFLIIGIILLIILAESVIWAMHYVCGFTLMGLSTAMILLGLSPSQQKEKNKKTTRYFTLPLCIFGMLSYEFFLFHTFLFLSLKPIITWIIPHNGWTWTILLSCFGCEVIVLTIICSLLYCYLTNPMRKKIIQVVRELSQRIFLFFHRLYVIANQVAFRYNRIFFKSLTRESCNDGSFKG